MKAALPPAPPGLSLAAVRAVTAVAETGSYAAAARSLGVSHSAVAQQIRALEAAHGIHLFDRQGGALVPTPVGADICDAGLRMLAAEADARRLLARRDASGHRRLRVGLGNSMPGMAIVAAVAARDPDLRVAVESGSHQEIMAAVLGRKVDVAVLPDVPPDPRFRRAPVLEQEVVAIAGPQSPFALRPEIGLAELAEAPLIFRTRGSSTQKVVDRAFRAAGLAPEPRMTADSRDAVYEAVAAGIGVGFMWRFGTLRTDMVRRIAVRGMGPPVAEIVFALADERNPLIELFLAVAAGLRLDEPERAAPAPAPGPP